MKTSAITILLATVTLITINQVCLARQTDAKEADLKAAEIKKRLEVNYQDANYSDWEGILFYCHVADKKHTEVLQTICEKTSTNAKFLAASAKIDFRIANDLVQVGFQSVIGEQLILLVDLFGALNAIAATTKAYTGFSGPIKSNRESIKGVQEHINLRSGNLILWERQVIGSGNQQDLVGPITEAIEVHLKEFFSDYLNAQK